MPVTIYHNPRCSKSRQTLTLLQDRGIEPTVIEYLQSPPDAATISRLLQQLGLKAADITRTGEAVYKESRDAIAGMTEAERIAWLADNPGALQRPIVVCGDHARIGRPPESVLDIIDL